MPDSVTLTSPLMLAVKVPCDSCNSCESKFLLSQGALAYGLNKNLDSQLLQLSQGALTASISGDVNVTLSGIGMGLSQGNLTPDVGAPITDTHDGYWAKKWLKKKKKPIELDEAIEFVQEEIAEVKAKQVIYKAKQPLINTKPSAVNYSGLISGLERELVRLQQEIDDEDEEIALLTLM